ncbi:oligomeric complex COG6 [Martensiomyces pterosporus]|nr:oligomeric complex COG6 [Martensiomyces pterosporus]
MYVSPPSTLPDRRASGSLGRRVQQIVRSPLDGPEVRTALEALASCYEEKSLPATKAAKPTISDDSSGLKIDITGDSSNASNGNYSSYGLGGLARHRDLRADMQEQVTRLDAEFLDSLKQADSVFAELEQSVNHIDAQCAELRGQVNLALRCTAGAAEQASLLVDERRDLATRLQLASEFISRFALTDEEAAAVMGKGGSRVVNIDDKYFAALDKVTRTRIECQKLMAVKSQTAVGDLSRELAAQEETAYKTLLRWVLGEVRELNKDSPEFSSQLKQALQKLQSHRPLFDVATSEIAKIRCESLARSFITALVRGGPNGTPRPIEVHAADPQRYVGDMLAWVHQACASEKELLDTLFSLTNKRDLEQQQQEWSEDGSKSQLLGLSLENLARPLEIRINQTTEEMRSPTALYRINNLLSFYAELFGLVCPPDTAFMATITSLCNTTHAKLMTILDSYADAAVADFDSVSPTLEVPESLNSLLIVLSEILYLHEDSISLSGSSHMLQQQQQQQQQQDSSGGTKSVIDDVSVILEKILREAHSSAAQNNQLRDYERTIFEHNVLLVLTQDTTSQFVSLQAWYSKCADQESSLNDVLCAQLLEIMKEKSHLPLGSAGLEGISNEDLAKQLALFNQGLKTATDLDVSRLVSRMDSHVAARTVCQRVVQKFVEEYAVLYDRICQMWNESGKDQNSSMGLLHTPETVSTLL